MDEKLYNYPILRYFDGTRPALLYTDASYCSIGAVLGQIDEQGVNTCVNILAGHYANMKRISEIELHSVVEAATRFRVYLASQKFKIIVDHKALKSITSIKSPTSPRLQRWA